MFDSEHLIIMDDLRSDGASFAENVLLTSFSFLSPGGKKQIILKDIFVVIEKSFN
jgi:hypothetical protein